MDFYHLPEILVTYIKNLLDTGLDALKTDSKNSS